MLITIEAVADPPENGMREVKRYAYRQKEGPNAVNPGDSLRDANHALEIIKQIIGDGIIESTPPRGPDYLPLFLIQLQVSNSHKMYSSYRLDYRKLNGCPLNVIADMMDIHATIRRVLRRGLEDYREMKSQKKEGTK